MAGRPRAEAFLHLVRLEGSKVWGWQLRLPNWHPAAPYTEYFADTAYGGPARALQAARRRRNDLFRAAQLPLRLKGHKTHRGNKSGLVGVYLSFNPRRRGPGAFTWVALWSERTKPKRKSFGVATLGFSQALMAAVEHRERMTGLHYTYAQICQALDLEDQVAAHARRAGRAG